MIFNLVIGAVEGLLGQVVNHSRTVGGVSDKIKAYAEQMGARWIGGDEEAFKEQVRSELIPAIQDFIAALAGINTNTNRSVDIMKSADQEAMREVNDLRDEFSKI
jgi:WXG100 family type VII secretion target